MLMQVVKDQGREILLGCGREREGVERGYRRLAKLFLIGLVKHDFLRAYPVVIGLPRS